MANLRRGIQQGRNAGTEPTSASAHDQHEQHDQGYGPGGTYDQER
ncbi:hypothetical protein GCM10020000_23380 [Streptomyces olivoverticillatus]